MSIVIRCPLLSVDLILYNAMKFPSLFLHQLNTVSSIKQASNQYNPTQLQHSLPFSIRIPSIYPAIIQYAVHQDLRHPLPDRHLPCRPHGRVGEKNRCRLLRPGPRNPQVLRAKASSRARQRLLWPRRSNSRRCLGCHPIDRASGHPNRRCQRSVYVYFYALLPAIYLQTH